MPVTLSKPEPTGPGRVVCNKVPSAEASKAMETKAAVSLAENFKMPARISGGVIVPTTIAATCCKETTQATEAGTRASSP